jgi:hypothetical protein
MLFFLCRFGAAFGNMTGSFHATEYPTLVHFNRQREGKGVPRNGTRLPMNKVENCHLWHL